MDMRKAHLGYCETVRKYSLGSTRSGGAIQMLQRWERIYLEEGVEGLMTERRGRGSKGRPRKKALDKSVEEDLIAENQRLRMEIEYDIKMVLELL